MVGNIWVQRLTVKPCLSQRDDRITNVFKHYGEREKNRTIGRAKHEIYDHEMASKHTFMCSYSKRWNAQVNCMLISNLLSVFFSSLYSFRFISLVEKLKRAIYPAAISFCILYTPSTIYNPEHWSRDSRYISFGLVFSFFFSWCCSAVHITQKAYLFIGNWSNGIGHLMMCVLHSSIRSKMRYEYGSCL